MSRDVTEHVPIIDLTTKAGVVAPTRRGEHAPMDEVRQTNGWAVGAQGRWGGLCQDRYLQSISTTASAGCHTAMGLR